jgi:O-antigen chain-terminating methyltransferase
MRAIAPLVQRFLLAELSLEQTRQDLTQIGAGLAKNGKRIAENDERIMKNDRHIAENSNHSKAILERMAGDDATTNAISARVDTLAGLAENDAGRINAILERMAGDDRTTNAISDRADRIERALDHHLWRIDQAKDEINTINAILRWANNRDFSEYIKNTFPPNDAFDLFYHDFEEAFRGTQEQIRERLNVYLLKLKEHIQDYGSAVFVDIGCGRGEWLDVLKCEGVRNYTGVDLNKIQLEVCREKGHSVVYQDCNAYLSGLAENSVDVITGFQIVEHLKFDELLALFGFCERVLRPNGVIIFETPNSSNLITAANYFYSDPTHKRPIYQSTLRFIAERSGFSEVEILALNPVEDMQLKKPFGHAEDYPIWDGNIDFLNNLFFGPQDYSVWGVKNGNAESGAMAENIVIIQETISP